MGDYACHPRTPHYPQMVLHNQTRSAEQRAWVKVTCPSGLGTRSIYLAMRERIPRYC